MSYWAIDLGGLGGTALHLCLCLSVAIEFGVIFDAKLLMLARFKADPSDDGDANTAYAKIFADPELKLPD